MVMKWKKGEEKGFRDNAAHAEFPLIKLFTYFIFAERERVKGVKPVPTTEQLRTTPTKVFLVVPPNSFLFSKPLLCLAWRE
jgi:hypothetical protein